MLVTNILSMVQWLQIMVGTTSLCKDDMKGHSDTMKNRLKKSINDPRYFYRNYCGTICGDFHVKNC